jgi:hypothetical protein
MTWRDGKLDGAVIKPGSDRTCRVRTRVPIKVTLDGTKVATRSVADSVIEFDARAGGVYILSREE